MIAAALLLAACVMQAEAAPAEPMAPAPPPTADPGPAEAAPTEAPRSPTPTGTPTPPPTGAPGSAAPPAPALPPGQPIATASLLAGLASRIGTDASRLGPTVGFSFGGSLQHRYAALRPDLALGLAGDFLYYRFSSTAPDRTLTETAFSLLQTFDFRTDATHIWFAAGGGLAFGYFASPELDIGVATASARQLFARVVGGADVAINPQASVGFRAGYMSMLTSGSSTTLSFNPIKLFVDLLDIQVGLSYRFY